MTLEKATINIGKNERQGLTFAAISIVTTLDGLRFQPPFSYVRYEKMGKCASVSNRKAKEERLIYHLLYKIYVIWYLYHFTSLLYNFLMTKHSFCVIIQPLCWHWYVFKYTNIQIVF